MELESKAAFRNARLLARSSYSGMRSTVELESGKELAKRAERAWS